jgi:hypothetical protein
LRLGPRQLTGAATGYRSNLDDEAKLIALPIGSGDDRSHLIVGKDDVARLLGIGDRVSSNTEWYLRQ